MEKGNHEFKPTIAKTVNIVGENIRIGSFSVIEDYVLLDCGSSNHSEIAIGLRAKIKQGAVLRTYDGRIEIGNRVSIGEYSVLAGHGGLTIGDCTVIAGHCYVSAANHIFAHDGIIRFQGETSRGITIGQNVWIGACVVVLDGIHIGDGCVVGAGSVVTKSLPPNTICFGVPCRIIKKREDL